MYEIHPRIAVARLGNSPDEFYLSPTEIGGLPIECDQDGNAKSKDDLPQKVTTFKDDVGRVKRQAARFQIFKTDGDGNCPVKISDDDIARIEWTVHIANKKPVWYTFSELQGNLEFGEDNSYEAQHIPFNNPAVKGPDRKALMIDPGPRTISRPGDRQEFSRYNIPADYPSGSFPPPGSGGNQINSLGELRMNQDGNLIALGGFGQVTGSGEITSFRGAGGYWDDIADGYVLATVHLKDGTAIAAEPAWLIIGSPKFAPELVNISTLHDTMYDVAIRHLEADPNIFRAGDDTSDSFLCEELWKSQDYTPLKGFQPDYEVDYETQVKPILERMQGYRWVADIPYLADFAHPKFDVTDASDKNLKNRMDFLRLFRVPVLPEDYAEWSEKVINGPNTLFTEDGLPLLPLNSGDNSVTNDGPIYKFETLKATQYFFLYQWAKGKFTCGSRPAPSLREQLDMADTGNCVGAPFSPGIETTWIVRNPKIYASPLQLKVAHYDDDISEIAAYYRENGLSTTADEAHGTGCEPGDLTKRMAIPWQSDFQECTVQTPNISNSSINQFADGTGIEVPPAYYVYWWPPQSPMHVMTGSLEPHNQVLDAIVSGIDGQPVIPAGQRVPFQRGILNVQDIIDSWSRLGFILNQGTETFPNFSEQERNFQAFGQLAANQQAARISAVQNK